MNNGIPFHLLLALLAATARARAARTEGQEEACDCPGCKFRKASNAVVEARRNLKEKREAWMKAQEEESLASQAVTEANKALSLAQNEFNAAADALAAEDAKAEGGAQ